MSDESDILRSYKTIAVVGLEDNPMRASHSVSQYMQAAGYRIIPVNPNETEVLGEKAYRDLASVAEPIEIVNVFRHSEQVPPVIDEAIAAGAKAVWLQQGIWHDEAATKAREAGLAVVQDACIRSAHRRMLASEGALSPRKTIPERPVMPDGYGITDDLDTVVSWEWVEERLSEAGTFWFSTTRPDGRPHAMPAWGIWLDGKLYFEGSPETRRAKNIAKNPNVSIHVENGTQTVILEGVTKEAWPPPRDVAERLAAIFAEKFGESWGYRPEVTQWDEGGLWALEPDRVFAWSSFPTDCTRFRFVDG
ncbi:MAG TPA: CoA-binding protein [Dehalococcoidia bacterium]|nr:CoA-binding protein [Dehalococcoidia bacterium]